MRTVQLNLASWCLAPLFAASAFASPLPGERPGDSAAVAPLSAADRAAIAAAHATAARAVVAAEEGYLARSREQQYTTRFDGCGFTTSLDSGDHTFGLELARYGWLGANCAVTLPRAVTAVGERLTYEWDERLEEWYVNGPSGLEHGYTVRDRADAAVGLLELELAIRGDLRPDVAAAGREVALLAGDGTTVLRYAGLAVFDATGLPLAAAWRAEAGRLRLAVDDRAATYPITIDPVVQQAYLKASNTGAGDLLGGAVAIDGDTVVIGATGEDSDGALPDPESDDSAPEAGAAYVFVRNGTTWSAQAYLKASNAGSSDFFGVSVAISGDTIVVGANGEASNATGVDGDGSDNSAQSAGAAYVFVRTGSTWTQQAYLKASNSEAFDSFGVAVAIAGDTVAVGAIGESSNATGIGGNQADNSAAGAGAAYVFVRSGSTWTQQEYLKASNAESGDSFGAAAALSGESLLVGASLESSGATGVGGNQADNSAPFSGAAYVFTRSGSTWSQEAYVKASNTDSNDSFGAVLALDGDTAVVGAFAEDSKATGVNGNQSDNSLRSAGAAYVFVRSAATWSQQAYLKASNSGKDDIFGATVSVSGDRLVVGAYGEDSKATGIDGNQGNNSSGDAGAAYFFARTGVTWSQLAYAKASNTGAGDNFGLAVGISGDTAVIGACQEDSSAINVDGNEADNSAAGAGAAYVFDLDRVDGSFTTYGVGTAGTGGFVPSATLSGSWYLNEDVTLEIRNGLGGAPALLITGFARATIPFAGGDLLVATPWILVNLVLGGAAGVGGAGTLDLTDTIPDDPAIVGVLVDFQVLVADPAAQKKLALSNGAELLIGG